MEVFVGVYLLITLFYAPQVGAIDQHRDLRDGNVKPNAQLPNIHCLW